MTKLGCTRKITTYTSTYGSTSLLNSASHRCGKEIVSSGLCKRHYKMHIKDSIKSAYNYLATARSKNWTDAVESTLISIEKLEARLSSI